MTNPNDDGPQDIPQDPDELEGLIDDSLTDDDFDAFVADDRPAGFEEVLGSPPPPIPPPPGFGATPLGAESVNRTLQRDPYGRLGGVASGMAHYLGVDPTLMRILFVLGLLVTGPLALVLYLISWAVMPRAVMWPPAGQPLMGNKGSRFSTRTLGLAALGIGALILFGVTEQFGGILVPFILIGIGVWLLRQNPHKSEAGPVQDSTGVAGTGSGWDPAVGYTPMIPQPVRQRSVGSRILRVAGFGLVCLMGLAVVAVPVGLVVASSDGDVFSVEVSDLPAAEVPEFPDFPGAPGLSTAPTMSDSERLNPVDPSRLSSRYSVTAGELVLDLGNLDDSMFDGARSVAVSADFGSVTIIVPDDLSVEVDARVRAGEVDWFGETNDGLNTTVRRGDDSPSVNLDVDVDFGEVKFVRP